MFKKLFKPYFSFYFIYDLGPCRKKGKDWNFSTPKQ